MTPAKRAEDAVRQYLGKAQIKEVQAVEDPSIAGVIAVRVKLLGGWLEFLVTGADHLSCSADHVAEVDFTSWPPEIRT
jgi:hypothetical protein